MPEGITDQVKLPKREFLLTLIILLRRCGVETGMSLVQFLEEFEGEDYSPNLDVDAYDDKSLRKAVRKYMDKIYPPEQQVKHNLADLAADDQEPEEVAADEPAVQGDDNITPSPTTGFRLPDEEQDPEPDE